MEMDETARRWIISTARKNFWRVAPWYELEDLIQDGYMWWYSRVLKYPHVTEPKHMMRLFQMRYVQHIHELSNKRTKQKAETLLCDFGEDDPLWFISQDDMSIFVAEAPPHIRAALTALELHAASMRKPYGKRKNGTRETLNERLCGIAGLDPTKMDIAGALKSYLTA